MHAASWRDAYRGTLADEFLDRRADADRLAVWTQRLAGRDDKLFVQVAEDEATLAGFICVLLDAHPEHGALLDNLHVVQHLKGRGLGRQLLGAAAAWCEEKRPGTAMHLWVYERNVEARRFYERLGAREVERIVTDVPGGGDTVVLRYGWASASDALRFSASRSSA